MRASFGFAVALLAAAVPYVTAQDSAAAPQAIPNCALACLQDGIKHSACAETPTPECMCTNSTLQEQLTLCVTAHCTIKETLVAKNMTDTLCGVPVRDRGATYDTTSIVLFVISSSIVVLRLGFKIIATRSLSADDYLVLVLVLVGLPSVVITHYGLAPNGVGRDIWTLTPNNITDFLHYFYIMAILYFIQVALIKLCLLLFYLRIFPSQAVRRVLWGTVIFDAVFGVIFFFLAIFQCSPVSYFWTHWDGEHEGKCLDSNAIAWANAGISIALDIWMLAIPLLQLKELKLHWKKKIGVGLMFCVGTFVTVVSIIRLQALVTFGQSTNATWDNFPVSLWSTVEICVGIMCTCMPTLRLLLVRLFPVLGGSTRNGNAYYYSSGGPMGSGKVRSNRSRPLGESSTRSKNGDIHPSSNVDTVPVKPSGIMRQQTFAVQYDDDEASLVHMRGLDHHGRNQPGDESA